MNLNFFSRIYLAITDFRLYPFVVQKEKLITALAYFLCFIILISLVLSTNATVKILNWAYSFASDYDKLVNDFSVIDGELICDKEIDIDFSNVKIQSNSAVNIEEINLDKFDLDGNHIAIIAAKDGFLIGGLNTRFVPCKYEELNFPISKSSLKIMLIDALNNPAFKCSVLGFMFVSLFIAYLITRMIYVLIVTAMLMFLGMAFRTNYKFKDYMKVAFYVLTLPTIIEVIALLTVGSLNRYAYITYYLLTYVYMFYAIRALKLDNIILATQERIINLKNETEQANSAINQEKTQDNKPEEIKQEDKEKEKKQDGNEDEKK